MRCLRVRLHAIILVTIAVVAGGCSGDSEKSKSSDKESKKTNESYPVAGRVTFNGQPLVNALVKFNPDGDLPWSATSDSSGAYQCSVPGGEYKVTVEIMPGGPVGMVKDKGVKDGGRPAVKNSAIPENYRSPEKTPLTKTIETGQNTFDIDIK